MENDFENLVHAGNQTRGNGVRDANAIPCAMPLP